MVLYGGRGSAEVKKILLRVRAWGWGLEVERDEARNGRSRVRAQGSGFPESRRRSGGVSDRR